MEKHIINLVWLDDSKESSVAKLATLQQLSDYEELRHTVEFVPTEILEAAKQMQRINHRQTVETIAKGSEAFGTESAR